MRISGKLCGSGEVVTFVIADHRIASVVPGAADADLGAPDVWISAGFLDLQLNGYGGCDFNTEAWGSSDEVVNNLEPIYNLAAKSGTAMLCPTITTNSTERMIAALTTLASVLDASPRLAHCTPGIHVEGPYLSAEDGPRGAHPLEHVRDPAWDEFQRFQDAAGGRINLFTLAPERKGALPFITRLAEAGVIVAIGHTAAEPEVIHDAVRAGARLSTHLGNGAHGTIRRHPNYIWEQLACDDLFATVIADGHHLPASVVRCMARVKPPEKLALVSDAVSLGGLKPGLYAGGRYEVLNSGKVVLAGTPYLAGAGHLLDTCVANAVRFSDLTLQQAAHCASGVPARILGLETTKGRLQAGCDADFTLFRVPEQGALDIRATVCRGEVLYRA